MDGMDAYYRDPMAFLWCAHKTQPQDTAWDFHLDEDCEIYALLAGQVEYFIEKGTYTLDPGQLILINNREIHRHAQISAGPYERIVLQFSPSIARLFNPPGTDLLAPFFARPSGEQNQIMPNAASWQEMLRLLLLLENPSAPLSEAAALQRCLWFLELLLLIRGLHGTCPAPLVGRIPEALHPVMLHIENNLDGDLSLQTLEKRFFMNRFHLGRLFLRSTGMTMHQYILIKRVTRAKELLAAGSDVRTAGTATGFSDLSNFTRAFTRLAGMTPSRYRRDSSGMAPGK